MKQAEWFDEFKDYLSGEPVPEIDFLKSREVIKEKLSNRSKIYGAGLHKKRFLLIAAAIVISIAAYPVYAISYSIFMELKNPNESISVKFQTVTDEIKETNEDNIAGDIYLNERYKEVIQERTDALKPGEAEVIIVRSPDGFSKKFLTHTIIKNDYINRFDLFKNKLKDLSEFKKLKPVIELPGSFEFCNGGFSHLRDWYTPDDEMEALMIESERNGKSYAVKALKKHDEIESIFLNYINKKDGNTTLTIYVQHSSNDTYNIREEFEMRKVNHNGDEILAYDLQRKDGSIRKVYNILKNDLLFIFSFSKDIEDGDAIKIIDSFVH